MSVSSSNQGCLSFLVPFFKLVPQRQVLVVERLGRFNRLAQSGPQFLWPVIDRPREITFRTVLEPPGGGRTMVATRKTIFIDLREQVLDFPKQSVITADNVVMEINAILYFRVADPVKVVYEIADFTDAIEKLTQTTLRNVIGELSLDDTLSSRDQINGRLLSILDEATNSWGVDVTRVELQDIIPPSDIRQTMELQMTAERRRRAQLLEAEANKASAILNAEGEAEARVREAESQKQASILNAEGEAEAMRSLAQGQADARRLTAEAEANALSVIAKAIGNDQAVQYALGLKYLDSLEKMADGQATKTFIPYEASATMGALGALRSVFGAGGDNS